MGGFGGAFALAGTIAILGAIAVMLFVRPATTQIGA
jgi:hypothetical protein